jgi:CDGSH-type Zn-finger protein
MDFAEKLRRRAAEAGHSVLVSTFHALIAAVDRESEEGKWETCVGPFEGVWHRDPCNHMVLAAHLTGQHLHLAHVQQHDDKTLYVVSWADEPDYERDFAARKRHMRPRLPDDPLFQEFESRKQKLSEKRKAVAESEEFKVFLASQPPPLTGAKAEREALRESRRKWTQFKDNMTREAKFQPPVREYRHAKLAAKLAPVPRASVLEPHRALQQGLVAAEPPKDVVVAVGPRKFMTKAEFLREKNAILDADFAERAKRNAEQLRQCKPDDLTGPLKEPGVKGLPVDLSEGQRSLCRCGQSAHFPFCDMSHVGVNARLGTKFSPFRVNAELVGKDVVVVCGCGESTKTIAGGIRVCDGTTCQNLPVAQKLRELEESPAEPEPMSVQLQRTSQVYEKAEEHKKNAIGNLRSSLRVQVVSERDFERLCDDFKAFVKFSTERLEMQHVDFPTSDNQRALVDFRADSLSVLQDLDARVQKLESTANEAGRDGGDFEDELQQVRKLRLAFNRLVADMEAEIEERVASQGPVTAAALARSHTLDEEDVLDKFDTMVKEYVSYARDTAARIEREYLEERVDEPAQQTLAAWQIDYREIERLSTTRFDDLEVMVEENKNSKDEFAVMLKFAVGARSKLHEAVKEVEEELKQKLKVAEEKKKFLPFFKKKTLFRRNCSAWRTPVARMIRQLS